MAYSCHARVHTEYRLPSSLYLKLLITAMPKDTGKENSRTRYQVQAQAEVQKLATHLMVDNRGEEAREIVSNSTIRYMQNCRHGVLSETLPGNHILYRRPKGCQQKSGDDRQGPKTVTTRFFIRKPR